MKTVTLLFALLLIFSIGHSQKIAIITDSASAHGLLVKDDVQKNMTWREAINYAVSQPEWRIPKVEELKLIYSKTYDKRLLRCAVAPGTYYTSEYQTNQLKDTVRLLGLMKGREFKTILPQTEYNNLLLVKDF